MSMTDDASAMLMASGLGELGEQILEASREAAKLYLDVCEQVLESIASYHEKAASRTEVEWLATAAQTQAKWVREMATRQLAMGRELLD